MHKVVAGLLGAAALVSVASAASATTIPFNYVIINTHTPANTDPAHFFTSDVKLNTGASPAPASANVVNQNGPGDNAGSVGGSASANLQTGQLKAYSFSDDPQGQGFYNQQNAIFGDGFRAQASGNPYVWTADSVGRFDMTIDGSFNANPGLVEMGVGGFVILALYQPGTLDPDKNLIGGPNMISYYLWLIGNPTLSLHSCDFHGNCVQMISNEAFTDFDNEIHISQDIRPGGDFDWSLTLGFSGQDAVAGDYQMDFSHTLNFAYTGPDGSETGSISGAFPGTFKVSDPVPSPEPFTLSLFGAGLAGVFSLRSRKKAK